jgi:phosphoribosylaminoimidazole-succinocarboxamide synthase
LPFVSIGYAAEPIKIEMVVRGYLAGHAWPVYQAGSRELCGIKLPEGLKENDKLPEPIITPTTKEAVGVHDQDISAEEILKRNIVTEKEWDTLVDYSFKLFEHGSQLAANRGLILVDTKYEFGKDKEGNLVLIDEIHTPDSSRYFYRHEYNERQSKGLAQQQLSKEFVRQWLIENGFQGRPGDKIPVMTDEKVLEISERYMLLYEMITGKKFNRFAYPSQSEIVQKILSSL